MKMMKKIAVFAVAFCMVAFVACSGGNTPTGVVEKYLDSVKSENFEKAIGCLDVGDSQEEELKGLQTKMEGSVKETGGLKSYEIVNETIAEDGLTASVETKILMGNKEEMEDETFKLKKVEDEWKIDLTGK